MILSTITFLVTPSKVCLAPKLEGFGSSYWNGYGGTVEPGETPAETAIRETREESTVEIAPVNLKAIVTLDFFREDKHTSKCYIYLATDWTGEPKATKEMGTPRFFPRRNPPLELMMIGDRFWIRQVLLGRVIPTGGFVRYNAAMEKILDHYIPLE